VFESLSGLSARKAAEKLNADGVPTPAGGKWHATQVIRVRARLTVKPDDWKSLRTETCP
jgi:hypothetical protein